MMRFPPPTAFTVGSSLRFSALARRAASRAPVVSPQRRQVARACLSGGDADGGTIFRASPYTERRVRRAQDLRELRRVSTEASRGAPMTGAAPSDGRPSAADVASDDAPGGDQALPTSQRKFASHDELVSHVLGMSGDPLEASGGRVVIHRGNPLANLMIVGEAPGQEEDAQGKPFVGKAGKLLDDIFTYAGFDMDRQVYLTNVAKRRPPNNRNPTQEEIDFYLPILLEEIRLVDPSLIILAGSVPLQAVLNLKGITAARGNVFPVERAGRTRDVMPIFHPAYLLRNKAKKREMLVDINEIRAKYLAMFPADELAPPRATKPVRSP